ncbi:MAG: BON domain-containing protein [Candidatus Sericytochromatia bacterium]|nr:BON domain-containing protein [Candidatus Tanganyikabacteria bacterium]
MHRTYPATHVKEALAADPVAASLDLKVDFRDETVVVSGEVASEEIRQAVDRILRSLPEVDRHVNLTRVRHLAAPGIERMRT